MGDDDTSDTPTVITVQAGFDWQFWALAALATWWAWESFAPQRRRRRRS